MTKGRRLKNCSCKRFSTVLSKIPGQPLFGWKGDFQTILTKSGGRTRSSSPTSQPPPSSSPPRMSPSSPSSPNPPSVVIASKTVMRALNKRQCTCLCNRVGSKKKGRYLRQSQVQRLLPSPLLHPHPGLRPPLLLLLQDLETRFYLISVL